MREKCVNWMRETTALMPAPAGGGIRSVLVDGRRRVSGWMLTPGLDLLGFPMASAGGTVMAVMGCNRRVVIFDSAVRGLRTIPCTLVARSDDVNPADSRMRGTRFPKAGK